MFVLCPHCQFLVALDPASGRPSVRCPRCQRDLREPPGPDAPAAAESAALSQLAEAADAESAQPDRVAGAATSSATVAEQASGDGPAIDDTAEVPVAEATQASEPAETSRDPGLPDALAPVESVGFAEQPLPDTAVGSVAASGEPAAPETMPDAASGPAADTAPGTTPQPVRHKRGSAPSFARAGPPALVPDRRRRWLRIGAIAALSLLLGLQLLLADRARLAADARWRPALAVVCAVLQCSLPPWREPRAFTVLSRDVRAHPTVPGALRVTATFRNDARWPQPWPSLLLTLSDLDGRHAGARVFAAREYLGAPPTRSGVASGQSATIAMDVVEPAPRIVAFTFEFR